MRNLLNYYRTWEGTLHLVLSIALFGLFALAEPALTPHGVAGAMIVNAANLSEIFKNLRATFNKAFEAAESQWSMTAMRVPSSARQNDYSWLSRFPKMRRWIGEKAAKALEAFSYTIVNEDWEATVEVDRNDIADDNLGIYGPMAQDAGFSAKQLPDEIVTELKDNAFSQVCYDGQYFYDTDHPVADGTVSNKGTNALDNSTLTAAQNSYGAARQAIMSMTDDEGRPLGLVPDTLEVPPQLEATGRMLVENEKLGDDTPNPYRGTAKLVVNPRLSSGTAWFLHVTTRPIKPFILQERQAPVFVEQTDQNNDDVFNRRLFKFGAEARMAGGYALWQMSYGSDGTT